MPSFYGATDSKNYRLRIDITPSEPNIANNTTDITYAFFIEALGSWYFQNTTSTINLVIDGVTVLNTTTQKVTLPSGWSTAKMAEGVRTISHNGDGTRSISFSGSFIVNNHQTYTPVTRPLLVSGTMDLATIPRATVPTLSQGSQNLGGQITVNLPRASTAFTHDVTYTFGGQSGNIGSGVGTSVAFTLPNELANSVPNGTSGVGTITCVTKNGATVIGTHSVNFTAIIPDQAPFKPNASITSIVEAVAGLPAVFIQNKSRLRVTATNNSGNFGATISQTRIYIDGVNHYGTDVTSVVITKTSIIIGMQVIDSRGFSTYVVEQTITLAPYSNPQIIGFSASRGTTTATETTLYTYVNFSISPINNGTSNLNGKHYRIRYRVVGGSWIEIFGSSDFYSRDLTHTDVGILNANNSYEIELAVSDSFIAITQVVSVGTGFELINFNQSGKGLAIGKVSEGNYFEVGLPLLDMNGRDLTKRRYVFNRTVVVTTANEWKSLDIYGEMLPRSGLYGIIVYSNNNWAGDFEMLYSATFSWYIGNTNATLGTPMYVHGAGHAPYSGGIGLQVRGRLNTANPAKNFIEIQRPGIGTYNYTIIIEELITLMGL